MSDVEMCWLIGIFIGFIAWCMYEAAVQYRFHRKMEKMEAMVHSLGTPIWVNYIWRRKGYIPPLFHEQRRKE